MYPELFRIGEFPVASYGVWLALGMLVAVRGLAAGGSDGLPRERIYDLGLWIIVGGLVGSKLLMLLVEDNVNVFSLDFLRSGGVFYGGLIGGFIAAVIVVRYYKLPFWKVADAFAPRLHWLRCLGGRAVLPPAAAGANRRTFGLAYILASLATNTRACRSSGLTALTLTLFPHR